MGHVVGDTFEGQGWNIPPRDSLSSVPAPSVLSVFYLGSNGKKSRGEGGHRWSCPLTVPVPALVGQVRKKFFPVRDRERFPREIVDAPSLEMFKATWAGALRNLEGVPPMAGVWNWMLFKVPPSANHSVILSLCMGWL